MKTGLLKSVNVLLAGVAFVALTACGSSDSDKPKITGERVSVLQLQKSLEPDPELAQADFMLPEEWKNEFWPQAGGYPDHAMRHVALNHGELNEIWSSDIGSGSGKRSRLNSEPIVVDKRIFTMDTDGDVTAFDIETGDELWRVSVRPEDEESAAITGGLAFGNGLLYVTDAYGYVKALNPENGEKKWEFNTVTPSRAAPTVLDGRVFAVTLDNTLYTLDANNGSVLWKQNGVGEATGMTGSPSPAADDKMLVAAFSTGDLQALRVENGQTAWTDNLSAVHGLTGGISDISDITASPVIDGGVVIAASAGGRIVAIDGRSGSRMWQREIGVMTMPWTVENFVIAVTDENELVALTKDTGKIRWVIQLPQFEDEEEKEDPIIWSRPVLAGGRIIVAGSNETVMEFNPADGKTVREWDIGEPVVLPPVVANGTLFLLTENGLLKAYK